MLTKLSLDTLLDKEFEGRHRAELGGVVRLVLDRLDHEDVRLHQPRQPNASAFGLRGYVYTLSPLVAMHLLDRSCLSIGIFLKLHAMFSPTPNSVRGKPRSPVEPPPPVASERWRGGISQ